MDSQIFDEKFRWLTCLIMSIVDLRFLNDLISKTKKKFTHQFIKEILKIQTSLNLTESKTFAHFAGGVQTKLRQGPAVLMTCLKGPLTTKSLRTTGLKFCWPERPPSSEQQN